MLQWFQERWKIHEGDSTKRTSKTLRRADILSILGGILTFATLTGMLTPEQSKELSANADTAIAAGITAYEPLMRLMEAAIAFMGISIAAIARLFYSLRRAQEGEGR